MSSLDTKTIDTLKRLARQSDALQEYFARFDEVTSKQNCDKYGAGFSINDDRFCVFSTKVRFCAYTGYYGSSSCSTFGQVSKELADKYLPMALDRMKREIFAEMAALMKADAKSLRGKAQKEMAALQELLDSTESAA